MRNCWRRQRRLCERMLEDRKLWQMLHRNYDHQGNTVEPTYASQSSQDLGMTANVQLCLHRPNARKTYSKPRRQPPQRRCRRNAYCFDVATATYLMPPRTDSERESPSTRLGIESIALQALIDTQRRRNDEQSGTSCYNRKSSMPIYNDFTGAGLRSYLMTPDHYNTLGLIGE